jgi:chromate transporter
VQSHGRIRWRFIRLSLWLGVVGFGGGFAIIQQLKRALVERERMVPEDEFLESFAVATALPGPPSTNLIAILGLRCAGIAGALVSVGVFLLPSVSVMIAFGALYSRLRGVTTLAIFLDGMSAATVGVVAGVTSDMGRSAIRSKKDWGMAILAAALLIVRVLTLLEVIALAGLVGLILYRNGAKSSPPTDERTPPPTKLRSFALSTGLATLSLSPLLLLFVVFARIGLATFGGGFAMIPAIEREIVANHHWLGEAGFHDAIVLGQITPGPVAIAATFIGYRVAGLVGAVVATVGMFSPPIVLSLLAGRSLRAFQTSSIVQGMLRGVTPVVTGILAAATIALWRASVHGVPAAIIAVAASLVMILTRRVLPVIVLAAGGLAMLLAAMLGG